MTSGARRRIRAARVAGRNARAANQTTSPTQAIRAGRRSTKNMLLTGITLPQTRQLVNGWNVRGLTTVARSNASAHPSRSSPHRRTDRPARRDRLLLGREHVDAAAAHDSRVRPARARRPADPGVSARAGSTPGTATRSCSPPPRTAPARGRVAYDPGATTVQGVFGPTAQDATCPYPGHTCHASDMNYLVVAADRIPWGHLNVVDLGTAGYRIIPPGTRPLACADIAIGDPVEIDGKSVYRSGTVAEKGENLNHPAQDGSYFPCMIAAQMSRSEAATRAASSSSAASRPGSSAAASADGSGSRPWPRAWPQLGLDLCTTPDCGLVPPATSPAGS